MSAPVSAPHPARPLSRKAGRISHAVFDFDGTLSWLRHGWPGMMLDVFEHHLPSHLAEGVPHAAESRAELLRLVMSLNGKPSILQMQAFAGYALERGVAVPEAETLRREFQATLDRHIEERSHRVRSGTCEPDAYVVAGARQLLGYLRERGVKLSILSSTIEHRVREEAELLGLADFFQGRIFGSPPDASGFTKRAVFERILREHAMSGAELLAFGDGPVEIADAKQLGGTAVAVCTDEDVNGSGVCDPLKAEQLLAAGADAAIPDFTTAPELIAPLFEK